MTSGDGAALTHRILVFNGARATAVLPGRALDPGPLAIGDGNISHVIRIRPEVDHRRATAS